MFSDLDKHLIEQFGEVAPVILPPPRVLEHDPFEGLPVIRGTRVKATCETVLRLADLSISRWVRDKPRTGAPCPIDKDDDARGPKSNGKNRGLSREQQGKLPLELVGACQIEDLEASQPKPHGNTELPKWTIEPKYQHFFSWVFLNNLYERIETDPGQKIKAQRDLGDIKNYFYGWAAEASTSRIRNRLKRLRIRSALILGCSWLNIPRSAFELIPEGELSVPIADIDFTKPYLGELPDGIWKVLEEIEHDALVLLRDPSHPVLTYEQARRIAALPSLPFDDAKEVRRTMKRIWRKIYKSSLLSEVAAEQGGTCCRSVSPLSGRRRIVRENC